MTNDKNRYKIYVKSSGCNKNLAYIKRKAANDNEKAVTGLSCLYNFHNADDTK